MYICHFLTLAFCVPFYFFKFSFSSTINITDNGSGRGRCVQYNCSRADGGECGLGRMWVGAVRGESRIGAVTCKSNLCGADLEGGGASKR